MVDAEFVTTFTPCIPSSSIQALENSGIAIFKAGRYETTIITEYFKNGIVHDHCTGYTVDKIWKIKRRNAEETFIANGYTKDRTMLLWHGTKAANIVSILENGFSTATANGRGMFGQGIYFADRSSKSVGYCHGNKSLFLCQVALGSMYRESTGKAFKSPPVLNGHTYHSVKGVGKYEPEPNIKRRLDGANVMLGKTVRNTRIDPGITPQLNYNEYIVYDDDRVLIRYIVSFK